MKNLLLVVATAVLFHVISARSVHNVQEDETHSVNPDEAKEESLEIAPKIATMVDAPEIIDDDGLGPDEVDDEYVNDEGLTSLDYRRGKGNDRIKSDKKHPEYYPAEDEDEDSTHDDYEDSTNDEYEDSTNDEYEDTTNDEYENATNDEFEDSTDDDEYEDEDFTDRSSKYNNEDEDQTNDYEVVTQLGDETQNDEETIGLEDSPDEAEDEDEDEDEADDDIPIPRNVDKHILQLLLHIPQNIKKWVNKEMKNHWKKLLP